MVGQNKKPAMCGLFIFLRSALALRPSLRVVRFDETCDGRAIPLLDRREGDPVVKLMLVACEKTQDDTAFGLDRALGAGKVEFESDIGARREIVRGDEAHAAGSEIEDRTVVRFRFAVHREFHG
jgi:hypothetical protein